MPQLNAATAASLRDRMSTELMARRKRVAELRCYRDGDHPLPAGVTAGLGPKKAQEARNLHKRLLTIARSNWCGLVVDAVDERLGVVGFRFDKEQRADDGLWRIYQANGMDAESLVVQGTALGTGQAMVSVWPGATPADTPIIRAEDPDWMIVAYRPGGTRQDRLAALKVWTDEDGFGRATLYTTTELWKWRTKTKAIGFALQFYGPPEWEPYAPPEDGARWPLPHPFSRVPVVEFQANPRRTWTPFGGGRAEFADVIDIQDRINETVFSRLVATHYHAFPQKWVSGLQVAEDDAGRPIEPFQALVDRILTVEDPEARFGQFAEATLDGYLKAVAADIQHLAAITKTPPHYLLGEIANISADALKAAEIGLVSKVRRHHLFLGEAWEEVARLAMLAVGDQAKGRDPMLEVIWRDPESRSDAQVIDGLTKLGADPISLPRSELWSRVPGATPQRVAAWEAEALARELAAAPVEAVPGAGERPALPAPAPAPASTAA